MSNSHISENVTVCHILYASSYVLLVFLLENRSQVAHRSALVDALYEGCKVAAPCITFHFSTTLVDIDFDHNRIYVKGGKDDNEGKWIDVDVILAADGVKSIVRKHMLARHGKEDDGMRARFRCARYVGYDFYDPQ